jgi:hypothetical protein
MTCLRASILVLQNSILGAESTMGSDSGPGNQGGIMHVLSNYRRHTPEKLTLLLSTFYTKLPEFLF